MDCTEEIVNRISVIKNISNDEIRIILNDYNISPKCTEIVQTNNTKKAKAIQMFIITKKVEGCTEKSIHYYMGTLRRFFNEINSDLDEITADRIRYYIAIRSTSLQIKSQAEICEL